MLGGAGNAKIFGLRVISDQDLEKIGVASLGHGHKLLRDVTSFGMTPLLAI